MPTISGLLGDISSWAKQTYANGEPYRATLGGLLYGDTKPLMGLLNQPVKMNPMTVDEATAMAMDWGPMALGTIGKAGKAIDEYAGMHRAPMKDSGSPLHNLLDTYPDDIYGPRAAQYYGHFGQNDPMDVATIRLVKSYKDNPDAPVKMYRAVPKSAKADTINNGDWVTINKEYAKFHGEGPLGGDYKIIEQMVPARKLFTNGDSIHEWGYDQSGKVVPILMPALAGAGAAGMYYQSKKNEKSSRNK